MKVNLNSAPHRVAAWLHGSDLVRSRPDFPERRQVETHQHTGALQCEYNTGRHWQRESMAACGRVNGLAYFVRFFYSVGKKRPVNLIKVSS